MKDINNRDGDIIGKNEWDWDSAKEYLYIYLTGKNFKEDLDDLSRQQSLANSMRSLGQVLHLLQDMAVPAHVRNDFSQGHTVFMPSLKSAWWGIC